MARGVANPGPPPTLIFLAHLEYPVCQVSTAQCLQGPLGAALQIDEATQGAFCCHGQRAAYELPSHAPRRRSLACSPVHDGKRGKRETGQRAQGFD